MNFMNKKYLYIIVGVVIIVAFWFLRGDLISDYKDAVYNIEGKSVDLENGVYEEQSFGRVSYFGNEVRADLDSDGDEDIGFIIVHSSEGSGTFYYAAVAINNGGSYLGTNAILLGDRIAPQVTEFRDGELIFNYADRAKNDPMTMAPSIGVSKYIKVVGGNLVESR